MSSIQFFGIDRCLAWISKGGSVRAPQIGYFKTNELRRRRTAGSANGSTMAPLSLAVMSFGVQFGI
jgi:hypothetical protein